LTTTIILDTESDGLLDEATQLWCICLMDVQKKYVEKFYGKRLIEGLDRIMSADTLIAHNLIKHDIPLVMKLYPERKFKGKKIIDTLLLSQLLNPDRWGGHGLEAWGERAGIPKPPIDDWSTFSMDKVERCAEDVKINKWTYDGLIKEAGVTVEGVEVYG